MHLLSVTAQPPPRLKRNGYVVTETCRAPLQAKIAPGFRARGGYWRQLFATGLVGTVAAGFMPLRDSAFADFAHVLTICEADSVRAASHAVDGLWSDLISLIHLTPFA